MIVIASSNGRIGIQRSMDILKAGGSAIDAVEAGIRLVEANPEDHTVGYSGFPNILGQVELDASIMDGRTLTSGAVGALQGYLYAITAARKVMDSLPHVFLVGEGAARFAAEIGLEPMDLLTDDVREIRQRRLLKSIPQEIFDKLDQEPELRRWVHLATDPERAWSTVNFIARDANGDIASGVSTSGWAWKYPGRLGDSPIIGAGNYADNRYGAAACTGMGEMAIRASTAHSIVFYMKMGLSVSEAGKRAMEDLNDLGGRYLDVMNFVAMDREGNHSGFTSMPGKSYIYQRDDMAEAVELERTFVKLNQRWQNPESE